MKPRKYNKKERGITVLSVQMKVELLNRLRAKIQRDAESKGFPVPAASPFVVWLIEKYLEES